MVDEQELLAERFEAHRARLRAVAYRMLGSPGDADDAVQEAWLRLSRSGTNGVTNLGGWLTTVVARVCLDMLRSRTARREQPLDLDRPDLAASPAGGTDPEHEAVLADSVGIALMMVLDTLGPAERLAFVLHDMFAVPFDEIGAILDRSPAAAKQLASRARGRIQQADPGRGPDPARQRAVVQAFLAAARNGEFDALVALLDPGVVLQPDAAAVTMGGPGEVRGAGAVAGVFCGRARALRPALVDGLSGAVWTVRGRPRVVFAFTVRDGKITQIEQVADPARLERFDLVYLRPGRVGR